MKQFIIMALLGGLAALAACSGGSNHDFAGTFVTANGTKFELRPDSTSLITFKDSLTYECTWKTGKDRKGEAYASIEFAGYSNYFYLKNGKLYRSVREMNHDSLGEAVTYQD